MKKTIGLFALLGAALVAMFIYAAVTGSIKITPFELIQGLWTGTDEKAAIIRDLRFPRILMSMMIGAALAVSGVLLQAVMRNPLADAGIIGISAGAGVFSLFMISLFPMLFFWTPLFAFMGGAIACLLVYLFSWQAGLNPVRMVLVGVAIHASFTGLGQVLSALEGSSMTAASPISSSTFSFTTWDDVRTMLIYGSIGLLLAFVLYPWCNLLAMQDKTAQNLGLNVTRARLTVAAVAVLLAGAAAAVGGFLAFVGLLVPAIARICVGSDHRLVIPFSAIGGALLVLVADTLGRTIAAPNEIPASVIMMMTGGPFLLFLLRKSGRVYGN
ncbi:iron ABC transporter permease [Paenibacillaceae bacterium]|nr:iron ABC transporter permease [Paenibacillaceae bacterium]